MKKKLLIMSFLFLAYGSILYAQNSPALQKQYDAYGKNIATQLAIITDGVENDSGTNESINNCIINLILPANTTFEDIRKKINDFVTKYNNIQYYNYWAKNSNAKDFNSYVMHLTVSEKNLMFLFLVSYSEFRTNVNMNLLSVHWCAFNVQKR